MHDDNDVGWEYGELTVWLRMRIRTGMQESEDVRLIEERIREAVQRSRAEGWEPTMPSDWRSLRTAGLAHQGASPSLGGASVRYYESVAVPVRRRVPS